MPMSFLSAIRRLVTLIFIAFVLVVTFSPSQRLKLATMLGGPRIAKIEIAGARLNIPFEYFDQAIPSDGPQQSTLLEVIWPDMRPTRMPRGLSPAYLNDEDKAHRGWILAQDHRGLHSLEIMLENRRQTATAFTPARPEYGLEKFILQNGRSGIDPNVSHTEIYVARNKDGSLSDLLVCMSGGVHPSCNHFFIVGGVWYSISYRQKDLLDRWPLLRQKTLELFADFRRSAIQNSEGE